MKASPEKIYNLEERIFDLEEQLESQKQEIGDLANIASVITSILDIEQVMAVSMETAIRQVSGEVGATLIDEDGELNTRISWGVDGNIIKTLKYKEDLDIAQYCRDSQKSVLVNDCSGIFPGQVSVRNFLASPIITKHGVSGVVVIFNKEGRRDFVDQDRLTLEMICKFTAVAMDNARLLKEFVEKEKMNQELVLARQVQKTFLPDKVSMPRLQIASNYIPARHLGGDYYDLIPIGENNLLFLIGDVTNKGLPAALVMTAVYSIVRAYISSGLPINVTELISQLNKILCNDVIKEREMFITLFMAYIDFENDFMEYCNGGHPPPFYYRAATGETTRLKQGGALVGQFAGMEYRSTRIEIEPGDRIFCYTDGLIEAEDRHGNLYGLDRLENFFKSGIVLEIERFNEIVKEEIDLYTAGASRDSIDDFTTLIIGIMPPAKESKEFNFSYQSDLGELEKMYGDMETIFERHKISKRTSSHLLLMVSEAMTNAIIHANKGDRSRSVQLRLEVNESHLIADIIDEGDGLHAPDLSEIKMNPDPSAEGGRGLGIIKQLSDGMEISTLAGGGCRMRIKKEIV